MPLTEDQMRALESLDWFHSISASNRRSGRSFIQAVAIIRAALRDPGRRIDVLDHAGHAGSRPGVGVAMYIQGLVEGDPRFGPHARFAGRGGNLTFWFDSDITHRPQNWLPDERALPSESEVTERQQVASVLNLTQEAALTQRQIAEGLGVTQQTLSRIAQYQAIPRTDTRPLAALTTALQRFGEQLGQLGGMSLDEFLEDDPIPNPPIEREPLPFPERVYDPDDPYDMIGYPLPSSTPATQKSAWDQLDDTAPVGAAPPPKTAWDHLDDD